MRKVILSLTNNKNRKTFYTIIGAGLLAAVSVVGIVSANGPTFNIFPVAYNGAMNTDYPLLDGRNVTAGESWSTSQSDHNAGVSANPGDVIEFLIYYHNGAPDAPENIAKDVIAKANIPTYAGDNFTISASLSASNAQTVYSSQKGGNVNVDIASVIPQSLSLLPGTTVWMPNRASSQITMPNTVTTSGVELGDIKGCWPYSGFVKFRVQVSEDQPNANLSIEKIVKNISDGTSYADQIYGDPSEIVEFKITVTNTGDADLDNVKITDSLPNKLSYVSGSESVSKSHSGDLFSGGVTTDLNAGEYVTVTFRADIASSNNFSTGNTTLTNTATAQSYDSQFPVGPVSDIAKVIVQKEQVNLDCPLYLIDGRILIDFNQTSADSMLIANGSQEDAQKGPFSTTIPADNYSVTLVSYDDHSGKGGQYQYEEQYYLKLRNSSGSVIASTNSISDLPDSQDWLTEQVDSSLSIPQTVKSVVATHSAYPDDGYESIVPVCAAFDRIANTDMTIEKTVKNITTGQGFVDSVDAKPSQDVEFKIVITNTGNVILENARVSDLLPSKLDYTNGTFRIDGASSSDYGFFQNIGKLLGNLVVGESKTITFRAKIDGMNQFEVGSETLTNTAQTWASGFSAIEDSALIVVTKEAPQKEDGDAGVRPQ